MASFKEGIGRSARAAWSSGRPTPNQEQPLMGFYTGIVMDDADDQRMGQVWVYIPGVSQARMRADRALPSYGGTAPDRDNANGVLNWDQKLRNGWVQCAPLHPFFGTDEWRVIRSPGGDFRNATNGDTNAYGMWTQARIGDEVGVLFVNGDAAKGYWIGMVPRYLRNFMVPGAPGRMKQDLDSKQDFTDPLATETNNPSIPGARPPEPTSAIHKVTDRFKREAPDDALIPALDKARRLSKDRRYPVERELIDVLVSPDYAQNTEKAGLLCDVLRGASTSSARRESPSYVMGLKSAGWNFDSEKGNLNTAGGAREQFRDAGTRFDGKNTMGHQFVMDDHPDFQGVRIRTSEGSQLYFNDSCNNPFIWANTPQGNVWVEMRDDGIVHVFAENSISLHSRRDINLTADRDINIDAQRDLNLQVRRNTSIKLKGETEIEMGLNDLPPGAKGPGEAGDLTYNDNPDWGQNTSGTDTRNTFIQNFGNVDLTVGNSDMDIELDTGETVSVNLARDVHFEVTNNVDGTIGNDLNLDVGNDTDVFIGANLRLETVDDIDFQSGGNTNHEAGGFFHILSQGDGRWTSSTWDMYATGGNITMTASPRIDLNGPQAATATNAANPNPVEPTTEPALIKAFFTNRVPTDDEIKMCIEPPNEFLTWPGMLVPQHMPWPKVCQDTIGANSFVDSAVENVSRNGATTPNAEKPLNLPEASRFREAQPYTTTNEAEAPSYNDVAPRGEFMDCADIIAGGGTSDRGIDFLHEQEGLRTKAYPDTDKYAIGYGHNIVVGDIINGDTINGRVTQADIDQLRRSKGELNISEAEARRLFREDLKKFEEAVCRQVTTPITQGQFDAMVSFAYNGGEGALRRMVQRSDLNSGDFSGVPNQWMRLSTASGTRDPFKRARQESALRRRRRRELEELFAQP